MSLLSRQGIRLRLALLYLGIFAVGLAVFCAVLFQYFQRTQEQAFDATLYNFAVDISSNLEMDFVGRLFVVNSTVNDAGKYFPFHLGHRLKRRFVGSLGKPQSLLRELEVHVTVAHRPIPNHPECSELLFDGRGTQRLSTRPL